MNIMKSLFPPCIAFVLIPWLCGADSPRDLAPMLQPLIKKYQLPGAVGAIIHGDKLVAIGSVGVRKWGNTARFLTTDRIHLGSDTKAMTAVLIGQLIDKKHISLDSNMTELFPDLAKRMNPKMAKNTVRNLLDHNAGFPHDLDWWSLDATKLSLPKQRRRAVEQALSVPPTTPIGQFSYSNVSYVVLGAIVEAKTGKSWEEIIKRNLFQPLKMETAGFGPPGTAGKVDQPWGHILQNGKLKPVQTDNAPVLGPAGRVHCSITDWSKFVAESMQSARGHPTLVSAETFKKMSMPMPGQDYAGGWIVTDRDWAGGLAMTHSGSNTTWYCTVWIAPKNNFAVMLATNFGGDKVDSAVDEGIGSLIEFNKLLEK